MVEESSTILPTKKRMERNSWQSRYV